MNERFTQERLADASKDPVTFIYVCSNGELFHARCASEAGAFRVLNAERPGLEVCLSFRMDNRGCVFMSQTDNYDLLVGFFRKGRVILWKRGEVEKSFSAGNLEAGLVFIRNLFLQDFPDEQRRVAG